MKIVKFKEQHLTQILEISNAIFGQYFLNPKYLNTFLNTNKSKALVAVKPNNEVVGFLFLEQFNYVNNSDHFITDQDWFNRNFKPNQKLTLIKHIALTPAFQNKGIGRLLLNEVKELNTTLACIVWDKGEETPLRHLLMTNGFKQEHRIENYWNKDSIEKKYYCGICGAPPCNCSAEVYIKKKGTQ